MHKKIQAMYFLQPGIQSIKIKARNDKMVILVKEKIWYSERMPLTKVQVIHLGFSA